MIPAVAAFGRADCELLARYGDARVRWSRIDAVSKRKLTDLRSRVKILLSTASQSVHAFPVATFVAAQHQHDRVPHDYWGCLYHATVPNKAFGLQLAIIISSAGAELCCCMGAKRRDTGNTDTAAQSRRVLEEAQQQLSHTPPDLLASLGTRLQGQWQFRKSVRQPTRSNDFDSLAEWVQYAASPLGGGASVSSHLSPRALEKAGNTLNDRFVELIDIFAPLLQYVYTDETPVADNVGTATHPYSLETLRPTPPLAVAEQPPPYGSFVPVSLQSPSQSSSAPAAVPEPFTLDEATADLFMPRETFTDMLALLRHRQNLILEGAPGVGKTFVARRLAYALLGARDLARTDIVQFHQSYAYEDFVQGWRPAAGGGFVLRNGVFYEFCRSAQHDLAHPHVFVIDEINRGNVSKIFGELLMLLERDKRGNAFAVPLTYAIGRTDRFAIPPNVHVIGTMNTADRSLAMVDYALRRRFAFVRLYPAFRSRAFTSYLTRHGIAKPLVRRIVDRMTALNDEILEDRKRLGPGFEIGHSFFVPFGAERPYDEAWYRTVIFSEIEPLLREYWFDDPDRVSDAVAQLLL